MGMLPNLYPGYQKVTDPAVRAKFAKAWGVPEEKLPLEEGYKLTDLGHLVNEGKVHCFYNYGEDPVQTADGRYAQDALRAGSVHLPGHLYDADDYARRRHPARYLLGRARGCLYRIRP